MIAIDTSVAVAAFASWHESHAPALRALEKRPRLPAHVAIEMVSVLTRLPPPHRAAASLVTDFLGARFPEPFLVLSAAGVSSLLEKIVVAEIAGGAVYDALIAATVAEEGGTLLTRDRRALPVYESIGVAYALVT